ncbi:hypothetical protein E4K64_20730 [Bradyrhizobium frederickii]|uniref:Uncharacterized protein n=1 Tax=Bradyrhizobium frederickii TaxID=2560054 RepID=A0A4Y9P001_9BRAD|nr:hypothetical protein [Bradyrhizobium frederickii]TFV73650.1 hypothetical protein E4K64_20730 [Bradyrhizobium frederickii]
MNGNLAQFREDLRLHLFRLQVCLNNISELFDESSVTNEAEFVSRLNELRTTANVSSERAAELRQALLGGLDQDAAMTPEVSRWIGRRQTAQLHARADLIEKSATIAVELATLSVLEAERITMTAILARGQAVAVQVQRDDLP